MIFLLEGRDSNPRTQWEQIYSLPVLTTHPPSNNGSDIRVSISLGPTWAFDGLSILLDSNQLTRLTFGSVLTRRCESQSVLPHNTKNEFVPQVGLEPTRLSPLVPKTSVSTIPPPRPIVGHRQTYGVTSIVHLRCFHQRFFCSPTKIRTWDLTVNSRLLYRWAIEEFCVSSHTSKLFSIILPYF